MYAATNVDTQQQWRRYQGRRSFLFLHPEVQAFTFRSHSSLNDQVTPYWSQPSFKAKILKPCVAHSMTCVDSNVVGNGSPRIWWTSIFLTTSYWIRVSDSCRTMLMAALLYQPKCNQLGTLLLKLHSSNVCKHEFHLFPTRSQQLGLKVANCLTSKTTLLTLDTL